MLTKEIIDTIITKDCIKQFKNKPISIYHTDTGWYMVQTGLHTTAYYLLDVFGNIVDVQFD
jgi:hypothetical protein